jgi:hypothetical protein
MKTAVILMVMCATAAASPWPAQVPDGWTEDAGLAATELAQLRGLPQTKNIEATIFVSPARDAQLTLMKWDLKLDHTSKAAIEAFDGGMAQGAAEHATRHVSDEHHVVGDQLHGSSIDEQNELRIHYERIYGIDKQGIVHMVSAICTARPGALGPCENAQGTLSLRVDNAATLSSEDDPNSPYQIGVAVGVVFAVIVVVWATRRFRS